MKMYFSRMSEAKKIKPSLSKGTRDFFPAEVAKRNYIFQTIKDVFTQYGFEEIETPAVERLETLSGKYGEEGDKLLFKILNSGDYLSEVRKAGIEIQQADSRAVTNLIAEKGLRYDLTVPLARYVVQHQEHLAFPFRRFHIGPVWRADRPQKGRYQEFYQCDADVIGSDSLLNEVELLKIYIEAFKKLGFNNGDSNKIIQIKINNRKILLGIVELLGLQDKASEFFTIIDKYDKIGRHGVLDELTKLNLSDQQVLQFCQILDNNRSGSLDRVIQYFGVVFKSNPSEVGNAGVREIESICKHFDKEELNAIQFDVALARGLNYYTGLITEVTLVDSKIGSLGGGGRYDNLTQMFGGQNMSGVGISFGIERIYDVMEELQLFPATIAGGVKVLFVPRDISVEEFTYRQVQKLRLVGVSAEIFLGNVKKQKQFSYAETKNILYIVEVGDNEKQTELFRLRNTQSRETINNLSIADIAERVSHTS